MQPMTDSEYRQSMLRARLGLPFDPESARVTVLCDVPTDEMTAITVCAHATGVSVPDFFARVAVEAARNIMVRIDASDISGLALDPLDGLRRSPLTLRQIQNREALDGR